MSRKAKVRTKSILSKIFCSLIYIVLFMPIAVVVVNSFNATTSKPYLTWKGFTFDWYVKLFENQSLLTSFGNTMIIALVTTVLSTIIGTLGAIGMYKYKFKGKGIIDGLLYIPVVIPEIVMGISLLTVFAKVSIPRGMLTLIIASPSVCHMLSSMLGQDYPAMIFRLKKQVWIWELTASVHSGRSHFRF